MPVESVAMKQTGYSLGVVILAAGRSSRMGQPKLLLPWGASSILGHLIHQWQLLSAKQITVVCSQDNHGINAELNRLNFPQASRIVNPNPERGMFSSIQCVAGWHPRLSISAQPILARFVSRAKEGIGTIQWCCRGRFLNNFEVLRQLI
jgi:hypothetical protein